MTMFTSQHFGGRFVIWVGQTDIFQREIARFPETVNRQLSKVNYLSTL